MTGSGTHGFKSQISILVQGLEENLRESQATAQRLETHLKQKEKLYEDKIKVRFRSLLLLTGTPTRRPAAPRARPEALLRVAALVSELA